MSVPLLGGCGCAGSAPPGQDCIDDGNPPIELHYFDGKVYVVGGENMEHAGGNANSGFTSLRTALTVFDTVGNLARPAWFFEDQFNADYGDPFSGSPNDSDSIFYVGGLFNRANGRLRSPLALFSRAIAGLKPDGTVSAVFDYTGGDYPDGAPQKILFHDNHLWLVGDFDNCGATPRAGAARFTKAGLLDAFDPGDGWDSGSGTWPNAFVKSSLSPTATKVYAGGGFTTYNSTTIDAGIVRIHSSGAIDLAFDYTKVLVSTGGINCLLELSTAKLLAGGAFTAYDGNAVKSLMRLNDDASFDNSFVTDLGTVLGDPAFAPYCFAEQADGKLLVGGLYLSPSDSLFYPFLKRLTAGGLVDTTFNCTLAPGAALGAPAVFAILPLPSGNIVLAGVFNTVNGARRDNIAFLSPTGAIL